MSNIYKSGSHCKYLLQYHLIFVCKYRKKLLTGRNIIGDVKRLSLEYVKRHNTIIRYMEVDKDHIHYMIETTPNINLSKLVRNMKSYITYHLWKNTKIISQNVFGKKRLSFPMDISSVQSEILVKKH